MTTTSGAAPAAPALPTLDTPEARWAYVLKLWQTHRLPTPDSIVVGKGLTVWLPRNERGQVDAWAAALGIEKPPFLHDPKLADGTSHELVGYSGHSYGAVSLDALCYVDLTADADAHGGPLVRPEPDELAAAVDGVVAMLVDEPTLDDVDRCGDCGADIDALGIQGRADHLAGHASVPNPVCNKKIQGELYCGLDTGHDGPCAAFGIAREMAAEPAAATGPRLAAAWQNEDGTIGRECVCGVTFDGFERKDAQLLDDLFAKHECNTLPPICGWLGGCNYGPDMTPAPAEPDEHGLCVQHRAEVFPELADGGAR